MKKIISLSMAIISFAFLANITFALSPVKTPFTDVQSDDEYYNAITFLKDKGVVNGYEDGSFKPNQVLNRAEFLKIIQEANMEEGIDPGYGKQKCFKDVEADQWYTEYVCYAKARGIIQGYSDGTFRPSQEVTLVESLKMTLKVFFYEYPKTEPWYKGVVDTASEINIIPLSVTGFNHQLTRGEMADIATRIKKYETGELEEYLLLSIGFETSIKTTYEVLSALQNVSESAYCTAEPEQTDIGSLEYPTDPQYENVGSYLGQLLTASDCEDKNRIENIFGVTPGGESTMTTFTLGSSLGLDGAPSSELLGVLKDIGYECTETGVSDSQCVEWKLTSDSVSVEKLFDLKPYVNEIKFGDCVNCG